MAGLRLLASVRALARVGITRRCTSVSRTSVPKMQLTPLSTTSLKMEELTDRMGLQNFNELPFLIEPSDNAPAPEPIVITEGAEVIPDSGDGIPDAIHHAVGGELQELQWNLKGHPDPWQLAPTNANQRGTKKNPVMVPSLVGERIVGCTCEEDSHTVHWYNVKEGQMKRCDECGNCFKVYHGPAALIYSENDH